jgi:hypothetical protein
MANYELNYPGASYQLDPKYNFTGYRVPVSDIGGTTSIQTANQLKEVNNMLNQGGKVTELSIINADVFEMVPQEQFKEIRRMNQLTGAESTLHAPITDPSGFSQQGWSEQNRELAEKQFIEFTKRAHELNPKGNIPVTIHSSTIPGSEVMPATGPLITEEEKKEGVKEVTQSMVFVDQATGQLGNLKREIRHYPDQPEGKIYIPEEEIKLHNKEYWGNKLSETVYYQERAKNILRELSPLIENKKIETEEDIAKLNPEQKIAYDNINTAKVYLNNAYQSIKSLFNEAYKYSDEEGKKELNQLAKQISPEAIQNGQKYPGLLSEAVEKLTFKMSNLTNNNPPQKFKPIDDFAREKTSETLSNVALNTYNQFGKTSPIISIENPPYGGALSSGTEMKKLVEETRKKFVDKMVEQGHSKGEAQKAAEQTIGVTWDTSHISMIRKQGFGKEKLIEEAKKVAPYVKHLHYNDNLGTTHTDLPPGMGDTPMKEVLGELEKAGFKGKRIFEGGNFFQHFQTSPFPYVIEMSGSPVYDVSGGNSAGPYWNQSMQTYGSFSSPFGPINPTIHHQTFGSGFQNLPLELGGEIAGGRDRMSGTPMQ